MSHTALIFFTAVAFCSISIILDHSTVVCAPVTTPSKHNDSHNTVEVNRQVDEVTFHNRKKRLFDLLEINPETINGLIDSQDLIMEGDIYIQSDRNAVDLTWPRVDGNVSLSYVITPDLAPMTYTIKMAMNMISSQTCVTFHERKNEDDYLIFKPAYGCASYVGFLGGEQPIYISSQCTVGNVCHELLHALGFYHEHSRLDRDEYIDIKFENIIKGKEVNFRKVEANSQNLPYDLGSILHYGSLFFSSNGNATIVPKNSYVNIGQRTHLSALDVRKLQKLYNCGENLECTKTGAGKRNDTEQTEDNIC